MIEERSDTSQKSQKRIHQKQQTRKSMYFLLTKLFDLKNHVMLAYLRNNENEKFTINVR